MFIPYKVFIENTSTYTILLNYLFISLPTNSIVVIISQGGN